MANDNYGYDPNGGYGNGGYGNGGYNNGGYNNGGYDNGYNNGGYNNGGYNNGYNNGGYDNGYNNGGYNNGGNYPQPQGEKPNYLVWSILVTIFCCLIGGIVCIVKANKANNLWEQGDYYGAQEEGKSCKNWLIASAIIGVITNAIYIIAMMD